MDDTATYSVREVAQATGIPARRLEGWLERGVIAPIEDAAGTGTRHRFSRQDALRVALIVEIQGLFGVHFRPGHIAAKIGSDRFIVAHLHTACTIAIRGSSGELPLILYIYRGGDKQLKIGATWKGLAAISKVTNVALVLDPAAVWRRIQHRLDHQ